jgi:hypothetical protein
VEIGFEIVHYVDRYREHKALEELEREQQMQQQNQQQHDGLFEVEQGQLVHVPEKKGGVAEKDKSNLKKEETLKRSKGEKVDLDLKKEPSAKSSPGTDSKKSVSSSSATSASLKQSQDLNAKKKPQVVVPVVSEFVPDDAEDERVNQHLMDMDKMAADMLELEMEAEVGAA